MYKVYFVDDIVRSQYKEWLSRLSPKTLRITRRKVRTLRTAPFSWHGGRKHTLGGSRAGTLSLSLEGGFRLIYAVDQSESHVIVLEFNKQHYKSKNKKHRDSFMEDSLGVRVDDSAAEQHEWVVEATEAFRQLGSAHPEQTAHRAWALIQNPSLGVSDDV